MDVDYVRDHAETKDTDQSKHATYIRQAGSVGSAAEHTVPEAMFQNTSLAVNDPAQPQGVSAVKALAIAASQGQKIYTLNPSNQEIHGAVLQSLQISTDVKLEIANALSDGKEVTVHEKDIAADGWVGNGYIILDQDAGAGAYKIAGGSNGGILIAAGVTILAIAALAIAVLMEMGPSGLVLFNVFF
ncbi:hypothetical protein [Undibacterium sp. Tian12W]|uniref:hypothetical protein n=1 Tax=Undibacterium sp. Tian12W TaxID=3413054 RepID=UPI003BEFC785